MSSERCTRNYVNRQRESRIKLATRFIAIMKRAKPKTHTHRSEEKSECKSNGKVGQHEKYDKYDDEYDG